MPAIRIFLFAVTFPDVFECLQITFSCLQSHSRGIMYACKSRFSDMSHRYRMVCVTTIHVSRRIRKRSMKSGSWLTQAAERRVCVSRMIKKRSMKLGDRLTQMPRAKECVSRRIRKRSMKSGGWLTQVAKGEDLQWH